MLTVVSWLWKGWRPVYTPDHVIALRNMLAKHLQLPHRFVCVTDQVVPGVECIAPWPSPLAPREHNMPDCYRRLRLFDMPELGEQLLSIDLDCVILSDITDLIAKALPHDFHILQGKAAPYNGSMWFVKPGANSHVWTDLSERVAQDALKRRDELGRRPFGSDQTVMAYLIPDAPMWTTADGIYQYVGKRGPDAKIVFFAGRMKPWNSGEYGHIYKTYLAPRGTEA